MRHRKAGRKFKRSPSHRRMLLRNLATSFFQHERLETTLAKAKEIQPYVEKLITIGREGENESGPFNVNSLRRILAVVTTREVAFKVVNEIAPRYKGRSGGYTRLFKLAKVRQGDAAPMAILTLVGENEPIAKSSAN